EQKRHRCPDGPSVALRIGHSSERIGQPAADGEDRNQLDQVRQGRRVLEWMRAVGVEETTAIGAEFLNDLLRRNRALRDGLLSYCVGHRLTLVVDERLAIRSDLLNLHRLD